MSVDKKYAEPSSPQVSSPPPRYEPARSKKKPTLTSSLVDLAHTVALPVLNVIFTCVLIGVLIYVFCIADGKPPEYLLSGMTLPTVVAIIATLAKLFVTGGLAIGLSEYKWVRMQRGGTLSMLDLYDASSRGIGAILSVLLAYRLDVVIIVATIFQIGLVAISPAAQSILVLSTHDVCDPWTIGKVGVDFNNVTYTDLTTANMLGKMNTDVRNIKGVAQSSAVKQSLFESARYPGPSVMWVCNPHSMINCTFGPVPLLHTTAECTKGSLQSQIIDVHSNTARTLSDYYKFSNSSAQPRDNDLPILPEMFYAGSMLGRTNYDLNNITSDPYNKTTLNDPGNRKLYGDQSFVLATANNTFGKYPNDKDTIVIYECTFRSALNQSLIIYNGTRLQRETLSRTPLTFNYDDLSNNTLWRPDYSSKMPAPNITIRNAYALQLQMMQMLIAEGQTQFAYLGFNWGTKSIFGPPTWSEFFTGILQSVDLAYTFTPAQDAFQLTGGTRCYHTPLLYDVKPARFLPLCLSLLLSTLWWVFLWISSLYRTNAISRGASQTALLVAGLSPALQGDLRGLSHAGQKSLLLRARRVQARFGEIVTDDSRTGHAGFGQPSELKPLEPRRLSYEKL